MDLLNEYLGSVPTPPPADMEIKCDRLLRDIDGPDVAQARLTEACEMVRAHPDRELPQTTAAQLLELTRRNDDMLDTWSALYQRFPGNALAMRMSLRWMARSGRAEEGKAVVASAFDRPGLSLEEQLLEADLYAELKDHLTSDLRFEQILDMNAGVVKPRLQYAKRLYQRGLYWEAGRVLSTLAPDARLSPSGQALCKMVDEALRAAAAIPSGEADHENVPSAALHTAISMFRNRDLPPQIGSSLGGVVFLTGSLGAGGSERQMTRMAVAMREAQRTAAKPGSVGLLGQVEVIVTDTNPTARKDFYQPVLEEGGVKLTILANQSEDPLDRIGLRFEALEQIAPVLPRKARYGLGRLTRLLRARKPEVIYLWQDGAVLLGALAALVAGIPRIVVSLRGLPPNLRPYMMVDEYEDMYKALARIPGVVFSANSRIAADAYADWLHLPTERFTVIPNASDPLPVRAGLETSVMWNRFDQKTDGGFVLGSVMRFHANKRPLEWVDMARLALDRHPDMRFLLVGAGPELDAARARAEELGLESRMLFAGASNDVGFWLSKMDAFLLLSEFEGLPNVLIEAQMAGVPVISTPAGGAVETFDADVTGFCLSCATDPDPQEILSKLTLLQNRPDIHARMARIAARDTPAQYALPRILAATTRLLKGSGARIELNRQEAISHAG